MQLTASIPSIERRTKARKTNKKLDIKSTFNEKFIHARIPSDDPAKSLAVAPII